MLTGTALVAALLTGFLGGFTRGISGFGASLVMVPLLALVLPTQQAVVAVVITSFLTGVPMAYALRREADLRAVTSMALAAVVGLPFGTWLLLRVSSDGLRRFAAVVVLATVVLLAFTQPRTKRLLWRTIAGAVSGLLNGAVSLGGPPVVLYFLAADTPAAESRASFVVYFQLLQVAQLVMLTVSGLITPSVIPWVACMIPSLLVGSYVGSAVFRAGGHLYFRRIALALLVVTGLVALVH